MSIEKNQPEYKLMISMKIWRYPYIIDQNIKICRKFSTCENIIYYVIMGTYA